MMKPKVAFFDFACCEGCQLTVLSIGDKLFDLFSSVEIVNFREASSYRSDDYDIAFIEGSVAAPRDIQRLKEIRKNARVCVALGSCAHTAGVNAIRNFQNQMEVRRKVYGEKAWVFDSIHAQPVDSIIKIDYYIPGCPIDKEEFLRVVPAIAQGVKPFLPTYPVCVECKLKGNVCLYQRKDPIVCLGPITRAGCGALCPSHGNACEGCRGLIPEPNIKAFEELMDELGISPEDRIRFYRMYNALTGVR